MFFFLIEEDVKEQSISKQNKKQNKKHKKIQKVNRKHLD